jgi:hypothetical protein
MGNKNVRNKELRIRNLRLGIIVICFDFFVIPTEVEESDVSSY